MPWHSSTMKFSIVGFFYLYKTRPHAESSTLRCLPSFFPSQRLACSLRSDGNKSLLECMGLEAFPVTVGLYGKADRMRSHETGGKQNEILWDQRRPVRSLTSGG
jgi:hypothetical protein